MIEIVPVTDSFKGSFNVSSVVDDAIYFQIYNEIFVEEWNQYIKRIKVSPDFIKKKWIVGESESANNVSFETLSHAEKMESARKFSKFAEYRRGKRGRYFEKLVDDFDKERVLIACHNNKFYYYEIEAKFSDYIAVYLIEEKEITNILNFLYLGLKKRSRVVTRKRLIGDFETNDEN